MGRTGTVSAARASAAVLKAIGPRPTRQGAQQGSPRANGVTPLERASHSLTPSELEQALELLGVPPEGGAEAGLGEPTLERLRRLQAAFLDAVPYENLDIHIAGPGAGAPAAAPLRHPGPARRVLLAGSGLRRGGYCFVLADVWAALLVSLGYTVSMHVGGVGDDPLPPDKLGNHAVVIVHFSTPTGAVRYVSDVGLGDGPALPFELVTGKWVDDDGFEYELEQRGADEWWFTHDRTTGSFKGFLIDTSASVTGGEAFAPYHHHYYFDAESAFRLSGPVIFRRRARGGRNSGDVLALRGCTVYRYHPALGTSPGHGRKHRETLRAATSETEWFDLVREYFQLDLRGLSSAERACLWASASARQDQEPASL